MPVEVHDRNQVRALMERNAQLVDVLGREEFAEAHLPGAVNLRLRDIETEALSRLDSARTVVVYFWDSA